MTRMSKTTRTETVNRLRELVKISKGHEADGNLRESQAVSDVIVEIIDAQFKGIVPKEL